MTHASHVPQHQIPSVIYRGLVMRNGEKHWIEGIVLGDLLKQVKTGEQLTYGRFERVHVIRATMTVTGKLQGRKMMK